MNNPVELRDHLYYEHCRHGLIGETFPTDAIADRLWKFEVPEDEQEALHARWHRDRVFNTSPHPAHHRMASNYESYEEDE